ncbi:MAG: HAD hydrolase-like protein [Alphaproteobacteria bacterium]|nr:HAD hydrolase-like protein [Alphaproteobacteria bacterium]MCB9984838.1 HAD hydrolase-like protein [Micavibrio sp.]HPQ51404.1 HAD hydrolase-like protein [Alphaproteobacteria bacterium]HRK97230.1 HAD hydrolase-like protein [Alphaproteobacteria bacterium]
MIDHSKPLAHDLVPPRPDAVLFDWDGTLIDSLPMIKRCYDHLTNHFGMPAIAEDQIRANMRRSARDLFPDIFGEKADEAFDVFYAFAREHHLDYLVSIDGADAFLSFLAEHKIPMGVVSNRKHELLLKEIPCLKWDHFLTCLIGAGEASRDKPAPDPLILARERMDVSSDACVWYVGDSETDMQAAIAANMVPVFVEHGLRNLLDCHNVNIYPFSYSSFPFLIRSVQI